MKKAGILIGILVVPVLIFIFMKVFFVNEFKNLEIINPSINGCKPNLVEGQHRIQTFEGIDQSGNSFSSDTWKGEVVVTNFINPEFADQQLHFSMARALARFKDIPEVKLISHTMLPSSDSSAMLNELATTYEAPLEKWRFIRNTKKDIKKLAQCSYGVEAIEADGKLLLRGFVLIDKEGRIRGYYDGLDRKDINRMLDEIALLLLEYNKQKS